MSALLPLPSFALRLLILIVLLLSHVVFAVALNFQSPGLSMDLNDGRFQDNGGCGYVLKPAVLMSSERSFDPSSSQRRLKPTHLLLKVQICSSIIPPWWIYGLRYSVISLSVGEHSIHAHMCVCTSQSSRVFFYYSRAYFTLCLQINSPLLDAVE